MFIVDINFTHIFEHYVKINGFIFNSLIILLIIDWILGVIKGILFKNLMSSKITTGMFKKLGMILFIVGIGISFNILNILNPSLKGIVNIDTFLSIMIIIEIYSIIGNISQIQKKNINKNEYEAFSLLILWLHKVVFKSVIDLHLKKEKDIEKEKENNDKDKPVNNNIKNKDLPLKNKIGK